MHEAWGGFMASKNSSNLDEKGRVLIPQSIREKLNLKTGEKVLIEYDAALKAITIEPSYEKRLLHLAIALSDKPGALAHAATALSKIGVDLVSTQSHSSRRGEAAQWIVECNPQDATLPQIKAALAAVGADLSGAKWV